MASCGAAATAASVVSFAATAKAYVDDYPMLTDGVYSLLSGSAKETMQWVKDQGGKDAVMGKYGVFTGATVLSRVAAGTFNGTIIGLDKEKGVLVDFDDGRKAYKQSKCFVRWAKEDEKKEEPKATWESTYNAWRGNAGKTAAWVKEQGGIEKIKGKKAKWLGRSGFGSYVGTITGYNEEKSEIEVTWQDGTVSMKYYRTFREWC